MKLAVMQSYFFPYIAYFQLIRAADKLILYENLNFPKKSWVTRNRILTKQNEIHYIIVPVHSRSCLKKIKDIELVEDGSWKRQLLRLIYHNYSGGNGFDETYTLLEELITRQEGRLHSFNSSIIKGVCAHLGITTEIVSENSAYEKMEVELETEFGDPAELPDDGVHNRRKKMTRIVRICQNENADVYLNPIGGLALYSREQFHEQGINIYFIKTEDYTYKQFSNRFVKDLSIIDVLMHNGREKTIEMLDKFSLI